MAAYFAFADPPPNEASLASIWTINGRGLTELGDRIEVIDDDELIRLNPRALQQEGLFLKIKDATAFDAISTKYISRYDIPRGDEDRNRVLSELNAMMINGRNLFRDLDGVATTARINVFDLGRV